MYVFNSHKAIEIGVNTGLWYTVVVKLLLFRDITTSKNGNDPLTSFALVNLLACFVFKYSLNFSSRWRDRSRTNISTKYLL